MQSIESSSWTFRPFKNRAEDRHCKQCRLNAEDWKKANQATLIFLEVNKAEELKSERLMTLIKYYEMTRRRVGFVLPQKINIEKTSQLAAFVIGRARSIDKWKHTITHFLDVNKEEGWKDAVALDLEIVAKAVRERALDNARSQLNGTLEVTEEQIVKEMRKIIKDIPVKKWLKGGFPFQKLSQINPPSFQNSLKSILKPNVQILADYLLRSSDDLKEVSQVEGLFGEYIKGQNENDLLETCNRLTKAYTRGDKKAGYYLLWVIKTVTGCHYALPNIAGHFSVGKVLEKECSTGSIQNPKLFIKLLMKSDLCTEMLDKEGKERLLEFSRSMIESTSFDAIPWPYKKKSKMKDIHPLSLEELKNVKQEAVLFLNSGEVSETNTNRLLELIKYFEIAGLSVGLVLPQDMASLPSSKLSRFVIGSIKREKWCEIPSMTRFIEVGAMNTEEDVEKVLQRFNLRMGDVKLVETAIRKNSLKGAAILYDDDPDVREESIREYIKKEIQYNLSHPTFKELFRNGLPFEALAKKDLHDFRKALDSWNLPEMVLASYLIEHEKWLDEKELENLFGRYPLAMNSKESVRTCDSLACAFMKGDLRAGYYLLWVIKRRAFCQFEMPDKMSFTKERVSEILGTACALDGMGDANKFVEMIVSGYDCEKLFQGEAREQLFNFIQSQFSKSMNENLKDKALYFLLTNVNAKFKRSVVRSYCSNDPREEKIASALNAIFLDLNYTNTLQLRYELKSLLPDWNDEMLMKVCQAPLPTITFTEQDGYIKTDFRPNYNFLLQDRFFIYPEKGINYFNTPEDRRVPEHLLAFDRKYKKVVWGQPLTNHYELVHAGHHIAYLRDQEDTVQYISISTGKIEDKFRLPHPYHSYKDKFYVDPSENAFFISENQPDTLYRRTVQNPVWNAFKFNKKLSSRFKPLSTHAGLWEGVQTLHVIGPTGAPVKFENCIDAYANGNRLFLTQKDPSNRKQCILSIRNLQKEGEVVSEPNLELPIQADHLLFGKLCENGELVLLDGFHGYKKTPLFVNLSTKTVVRGEEHLIHPRYNYFIDEKRGEVWIHGQKKLRKISSTSNQVMGDALYWDKPIAVEPNGKLLVGKEENHGLDLH